MKLSTLIAAGCALAGAASVATSASATATLFENYDYSYGDGAYLYVTNNDSFAYTDVNVGGYDLGSLAAGATSSQFYYGDPSETVSSYVTVNITSAHGSGTGTFYAPDYDYTTSGQNIGTVTVGVPEPSAWALMLVGFGGLGAVVRRRKAIATA